LANRLEFISNFSTHRYRELLLNSFVSARTNLRFCPYPSCTETISSSVGSGSKHTFTTFVPTVTCGNQHSFCFGCNSDSEHRPVPCHWVALWQKNTREDAGTAQWIKANTRECPKCSNNIEKSGGCKLVLFFPNVSVYLIFLKSHGLSSLPISVLLDVSAELGRPRLLRNRMQYLEGEKRGPAVG